jgi:excinuclease ABC subunit C
MEQGFQYVQEKIKSLTTAPGCYLMKDHQGEIFYIGKAKNLRTRLKSYFLGTDTRIFVQYLEHILSDIEIMVVRNDIEALVLERELIKKHKPRFNITLKDDKNYILLKLKRAHQSGRKRNVYPRLEIVRRTKKDGARYFGPYPSAQKLRTTVDIINKYFMLRTCTDQVLENRARPCIQYQIGRCPAPCVYDLPQYETEVENTVLFLGGNYQEIERRLRTKMWALSEHEQFEAAAKIRDQLEAIRISLTSQVVSEVNRKRDQDIIGFHRIGPEVEIIQIHVRHGTWHQSHNYAFSDQPFPSEEIVRAFMHQAYSEKNAEEIPHDILLCFPIVSELSALHEELSLRKGRSIHLAAPQKGKQKRLVELANKNAEIALVERITQQNSREQALIALQEKLGLAIKPTRIECIDISLIQNSDPFGSVVVFINGQPDKSKYRIFKIKTVPHMNDFAMIHEVVTRRITRGIADNDLPDLLLIDGGKGQLNAALKAIDNTNLLVSTSGFFVASIAKARTIKETSLLGGISVNHSSERLFLPHATDPLVLHPHTYEHYLIERIRDEAHRFALSAHRRSRTKRTLQSELLAVPGIGRKRALMLLKHFGSIKTLKKASAEAITKTIKVNTKKAQEILDHLTREKN